MILGLKIALAIIMPIEWVAAGKRWIRMRIVTKPLSLILLIMIFSNLGGWTGPGVWFGTGLVFSLFGDISLIAASTIFHRRTFFFSGCTYPIYFRVQLWFSTTKSVGYHPIVFGHHFGNHCLSPYHRQCAKEIAT